MIKVLIGWVLSIGFGIFYAFHYKEITQDWYKSIMTTQHPNLIAILFGIFAWVVAYVGYNKFVEDGSKFIIAWKKYKRNK